MVERAERQDAERAVGADQGRGDRAQGAIAAGGDDRLAAVGHGAAREVRDLAAILGKDDTRLRAVAGEQGGNLVACLPGPVGAGRGVEDARHDGRTDERMVCHGPPLYLRSTRWRRLSRECNEKTGLTLHSSPRDFSFLERAWSATT